MAKAISCVGMVKDDWQEIGLYELSLLQERGVQPGHSVLDVGCGSFRLGSVLIPYLGMGRYWGIDIDLELLKIGRREVLKAQGLLEYKPQTRWGDITTGRAIGGTFDYVWCYAVLDHIQPEKLATAFTALGACTGPQTRTFATAFVSVAEGPQEWWYNGKNGRNVTTYRNRDPWHYRLDEIEAAAVIGGLRLVPAGLAVLPRFCPMALMEFRKG